MKQTFFIILILLPFFASSQKGFDKVKSCKDDVRIISNTMFSTQGAYYPLSVTWSPWVIESEIKIKYGFNQHDVKKANNEFIVCRAEFAGKEYKTPPFNVFDTLTCDTIYSILGDIMCKLDSSVLLKYIDPDVMHLAENLITINFKYNYLLSHIEMEQDNCEVIRILFPISNSLYSPLYSGIVIKPYTDSIVSYSFTIDAFNRYNIKVYKSDVTKMNSKNLKKLKKQLSDIDLNNIFDCSYACRPFTNLNLGVIEFITKDSHKTYFISDAKATISRKDRTFVKKMRSIFYICNNAIMQQHKAYNDSINNLIKFYY